MSWLEVNKVEQRKQFIIRHLSGERITDLCNEYEISRKTGYKFIDRFKKLGFEGLNDLSKRPYRQPNKTDDFIEGAIVSLKSRHPSWGPKKLKTRLEEIDPGLRIPSASTIGIILSRHGLVNNRPRRISRSYHPTLLTEGLNANDVWCIDFKGQFKMQNSRYCYPLTISDYRTRYLIACECLEKINQEDAFQVFKHAFIEYGQPRIIRSDNGAPFSSGNALYGLSKLSIWFLKQGIKHERIEPGHPEQNGRHERLHRTLKQDALRPTAKNIMQQQEVLDKFRDTYNNERPHEALGQKTPASIYKTSDIKYTERTLTYPLHDFTKNADCRGCIWLKKSKPTRISRVFYGETLGLRELDDTWLVSYADYDIGLINKKTLKFESMESIDAY
jgi:putative transposase